MSNGYRVEEWTAKTVPSASQLKRWMENEGFSVFQWSDPLNAYYSPHVHGDEQSHWIVSGMLELDVTGYGTYILSAGDRDLMPANTEHSATVVGDGPVVYLIGAK